MSFQVKYLYDLVDKVSPSLRKIQSNVQKTANAAQSGSRKMVRSFNSISIAVKNTGKQISSFGSAVRSVGMSMTPFSIASGVLARSSLKSAASFEALAMKMEVLTGSAQKGKQLFEEIVSVASTTPFELKDLADQTVKLMGYGVATEDVIDQLKLIGDVSAISGGDLNGITTAFGQAAAAGRVMGIDLLQFVNNGVPMIKMLAKTMQVPKEQIKDLVSEGKVTFPILLQAFRDATGEGGAFENGMAKLSQTLTGLYSTLKDSVNIALGEFGGELAKSVNLKELVKSLSVAIGELVNKFKNLSPQTKKIISYAVILTTALAPLLIVLGQVAIGVGALVVTFGLLTSPIGLIALAIGGLSASFIYFYDNIKEIYSFIKDKFMGALNFVSDIGSKINSIFNFTAPDINQSINQNLNNILPTSPIINQRQDVNVGGRLDVNFSNMPKGTNARFTPIEKNPLPVGINSVYGGV